jgi:hypothetical protein
MFLMQVMGVVAEKHASCEAEPNTEEAILRRETLRLNELCLRTLEQMSGEPPSKLMRASILQ